MAKSLKEKIITFSREHPELGYKRIGQIFGCSHNTVKYHLNRTGMVHKDSSRRRVLNAKSNILKLKESAGGKCSICGYSKCKSALEFHHTDPSNKGKHASIGAILRSGSIAQAQEEVKKCILICANCHREKHYPD